MIMGILNQKDHRSCFHYEGGDRPTVEIRKLEAGHQDEIVLYRNEIVFVTEGEVRCSFRSEAEKLVRKDEFVFIPVGGTFRYKVLKTARITIVRLNTHIHLCEGCRIEELYPSSHNNTAALPVGLFALKINRPMQRFLYGLNETTQGGLKCRYYFNTKVRELFILLKAYYPLQDLQAFFSLLISSDTAFSERVRASHQRYRTVVELASSMNLSTKHFEKVFKRVLGVSPGKWMNNEKAQLIHHELRLGDKPLKQIAEEYGFSTQQQLNRFCKRELGNPPRQIRLGKNDQ
jgi:AraC-like DNA-binding protein